MKILRSKIPMLLGLLLVLPAIAPCPAQEDNQYHDIIIPKIKMDDVPVADAIVNLARQAKLNFIVDSRVSADSNIPPVTIAFENVTAKEALDRILKIRRLVRIENPATTVSRIAPANLGIKPVNPDLLKNDTNLVCPQMVMDSVPLRDALRILAKQAGLEASFDEKLTAVQSTYISVRWTQLTPKQALVALLDNYDLVMKEESPDGTAKITHKKPPAESKSP